MTERLPDPRLIFRNRLVGFGAAGIAGLLVELAAPGWLAGTDRAVAAFDAAALALLAALWLHAFQRDPLATYLRAAVDDPGHNLALGVAVLSALAGLVAAIAIIGSSAGTPMGHRLSSLAIGLTAVVLGWVVIHSMFVFRYAHLYYSGTLDGEPVGTPRGSGLAFPGPTPPSDHDFAYFSFVIGMTFQVSDVVITAPEVRRVVLLHALISFAYNTTILALVVNLASGLVGH